MECNIPTSLVRQRYGEGKYQETGLKDTEDFDKWLKELMEETRIQLLKEIISYCPDETTEILDEKSKLAKYERVFWRMVVRVRHYERPMKRIEANHE